MWENVLWAWCIAEKPLINPAFLSCFFCLCGLKHMIQTLTLVPTGTCRHLTLEMSAGEGILLWYKFGHNQKQLGHSFEVTRFWTKGENNELLSYTMNQTIHDNELTGCLMCAYVWFCTWGSCHSLLSSQNVSLWLILGKVMVVWLNGNTNKLSRGAAAHP